MVHISSKAVKRTERSLDFNCAVLFVVQVFIKVLPPLNARHRDGFSGWVNHPSGGTLAPLEGTVGIDASSYVSPHPSRSLEDFGIVRGGPLISMSGSNVDFFPRSCIQSEDLHVVRSKEAEGTTVDILTSECSGCMQIT